MADQTSQPWTKKQKSGTKDLTVDTAKERIRRRGRSTMDAVENTQKRKKDK